MYKYILSECFIDTCLINCLLGIGKPDKGANHTKGISVVFNKLEEKFGHTFALGIVDRDDNSLVALKSFVVVNKTIEDYAILHKHKEKHHYLIQICPESETWICNTSRALRIDLRAEFQLPDTPQELSKKTKITTSNVDPTFISLFKKIKRESESQNFEPVLKMIGRIIHLKDEQFQADISALSK